MRNKLYLCHKTTIVFLLTGLVFFGIFACVDPVKTTEYEVSIKNIDSLNKAPALQSFIHGVNGSDWLLFAGRTNSKTDSIGGLHNLNANYADSSFLPKSFNRDLFVYNFELNKRWTLPLGTLLDILNNHFKNDDIKFSRTAFVNTNALVTQDDEGFLYYLGGYGPDGSDTTKYKTYNQIVKIHIPSMISLIKGELKHVDWLKLIRVGRDSSNTLISTGGELFKINNTFYMAGGQNFGASQASGQKYVSAVYPFTLTESLLKSGIILKVDVKDPISDVSNPMDSASADNSIFRRRDAPIVPALFKNSPVIEQGITFYAGVFQFGTPPPAWNDAIYVHPNWKNANKRSFTYDSLYNQANHNVYATADFVAYDSSSGTLHTFLLGGIGDGIVNADSTLSGFTNDGVHITMGVNSLKSSYTLLRDVFNYNSNYYGAESALILNNSNLDLFKLSNGDKTEIVDLVKSFSSGKDTVNIGYIYGGIESYEANPHTYGSNKSAASNKIWKVSLTKK